jgi:hypothetical protein
MTAADQTVRSDKSALPCCLPHSSCSAYADLIGLSRTNQVVLPSVGGS